MLAPWERPTSHHCCRYLYNWYCCLASLVMSQWFHGQRLLTSGFWIQIPAQSEYLSSFILPLYLLRSLGPISTTLTIKLKHLLHCSALLVVWWVRFDGRLLEVKLSAKTRLIYKVVTCPYRAILTLASRLLTFGREGLFCLFLCRSECQLEWYICTALLLIMLALPVLSTFQFSLFTVLLFDVTCISRPQTGPCAINTYSTTLCISNKPPFSVSIEQNTYTNFMEALYSGVICSVLPNYDAIKDYRRCIRYLR